MNYQGTSQIVTQNMRGGWSKLKPSYRAAIIIAVLAILWMASGVFTSDIVVDQQVQKAEVVPRVQVAQSRAILHTRTVAIYGRVEAGRGVDLRSEYDATVTKVVATKGAAVSAGDVLVRFDGEGRAERLAEAKARLERATIAYEAARKLGQEGFRSKINTAGAKADLEAAKAVVSKAESDARAAILRAPFAGVVDDIGVEVGDFISKGRTVSRVIDLNELKVVGEVAERDAAKVALGTEARVLLMDGRKLLGLVTFVSRTSNVGTRTYSIEVTIENDGALIPEGVTAEIRVPMETRLSHRLSPALLTLNDAGQLGVKTIEADGTVGFYAVDMVSDTKDGIWLAGLPETVRIITVGQEFVRPGLKVEAIDAEMTAPTASSMPGG